MLGLGFASAILTTGALGMFTPEYVVCVRESGMLPGMVRVPFAEPAAGTEADQPRKFRAGCETPWTWVRADAVRAFVEDLNFN